jgi:hypothetical protein
VLPRSALRANQQEGAFIRLHRNRTLIECAIATPSTPRSSRCFKASFLKPDCDQCVIASTYLSQDSADARKSAV